MKESDILITGSNGQLGRALQAIYPNAKKTDSVELDITDQDALKRFDWSGVKTIINAAGYTNVDGAETPEGKVLAWKVNDEAVGNLAKLAKAKDLVLVHISTDYVFNGTKNPHSEDEPFSPLGVYGRSKAAGDIRVSRVPKHYLVRTSWVIGNGKNFVRTMLEIGKLHKAPENVKKTFAIRVVSDQIGRPTFATELARAIKFLIDKNASYGTYHMTNEGQPVSWSDFTRAIFAEAGFNLNVIDTTSEEYFASKPGVAPRPLNSVLDLSKIEATGFKPRDWQEDLKEYIKKEVLK